MVELKVDGADAAAAGEQTVVTSASLSAAVHLDAAEESEAEEAAAPHVPAAPVTPVKIEIPASAGIAFDTMAKVFLSCMGFQVEPLQDVEVTKRLATMIEQVRPLAHAADYFQMNNSVPALLLDKKLVDSVVLFEKDTSWACFCDPATAESRKVSRKGMQSNDLMELIGMAHRFHLDGAYAEGVRVLSEAKCGDCSHPLLAENCWFDEAGNAKGPMADLPLEVNAKLLALALKTSLCARKTANGGWSFAKCKSFTNA